MTPIDYKQLSADTNLTEQFLKEVIEAHADRHGMTTKPHEIPQASPPFAAVFELTRKREERSQAEG